MTVHCMCLLLVQVSSDVVLCHFVVLAAIPSKYIYTSYSLLVAIQVNKRGNYRDGTKEGELMVRVAVVMTFEP